jgi:hypothetical protein
MWKPRRLTTVWASTACYRYSFTFYLYTSYSVPWFIKQMDSYYILTYLSSVGSEVLTAVLMKTSIFWNITSCSPLSQLMFQRNMSPPSSESKNKQSKKSACKQVLAICFRAGFLDIEDGGDMFLWNVSWLSVDYAVYPRTLIYHVSQRPNVVVQKYQHPWLDVWSTLHFV